MNVFSHLGEAVRRRPTLSENFIMSQENPTPDRDAKGRFAPGNPFGRRLAAMREAV
jgi:hypothetical protein